MLNRKLSIFITVCIWLLAATCACAQSPALDIQLTDDWWVQTNFETGTGNDGTSFSPKVDIQITDLGFYDHDQDGLELEHTLSLYEFGSRELLASVDVGPATTNLNGLFRYEPISPVTLTAGASYMISSWSLGGFQDNTVEFWNKPKVEVADEIDADRYYFTVSEDVRFPTDGTYTERFYFGPNFLFRVDTGDISRFDFNNDLQATCADIDLLANAIANQTPDVALDLNGDFQLDLADIESWLFGVGSQTIGSGFENGDANLDGSIDAQDHAIWEANRYTDGSWCGGDFSADGKIDGSDFNIWNDARPAASPSSVPEPGSFTIFVLSILLSMHKLRCRHASTA